MQLVALLLQGLALVEEADGFGGEAFLAEVEIGNFGLGAEDVPPRGLRPLHAEFQLQAALVDRAAAFLAALLELPQSRPQIPQPLFALGQLDLGVGCLATAGLPVNFMPSDLLLEAGQAGFHLGHGRLMPGALFARIDKPCDRRVVLHGGRPQFAFLRGPLLLELGTALFGGRQLDAVFGQPLRSLGDVRRCARRVLPAAGRSPLAFR